MPSIPPDGVMVTVLNVSDGTLILCPGDEIAELLVLQALIPKFHTPLCKTNKVKPNNPMQAGTT